MAKQDNLDSYNRDESRASRMLHIKNLSVNRDDIAILDSVDLSIDSGTVHVLMGPNGSGKTTLAYTLMGHPAYTVTSGSAELQGACVLSLSPDKRARAGIFLSFQHPVALPGVRVATFLLEAYRAVTGDMISISAFNQLLQKHMERLSIDPAFMYRDLNDGFSGGEKKRFELLQLLVLRPKIAILDEIDSGLDVAYARSENPELSLIIITHYQRILHYVRPDFVHVLRDGVLVASGGPEIVLAVEQHGFESYPVRSEITAATTTATITKATVQK
jgi:Fe-S cluster assembly ATP-binding protein